jgi:hypothetical protein
MHGYPCSTRTIDQGCGSGSGFNDFVNPDPYWESGSRGKKNEEISVEKCTGT